MASQNLAELIQEFRRLATTGVPPEDASTAYTWSPWVYACIRRLSDAAANIPLVVVQGDTDNRENGRYQRLLDRPNELGPARSFRDAVYSWLFLEGRAPVFLDDGGGFRSSLKAELGETEPIDGLICLNPNRLREEPGTSGMKVERWEYKPRADSAEYVTIHDSRLMRIEAFGTGDSPVGAGTVLESFALPFGKWANQWNAEGFRSGGAHRRYLVSMKRNLDDEGVVENMRQKWRRLWGGKSNRDPIFQGSNAKVDTIGDSHSDMGFNELYNLYIMEVAAAFGAPPSILGILKHANYNSLTVQERLFYEISILPATRLVTDALNFRVTPRFRAGLRAKADLSDVKVLQENLSDWVKWAKEGVGGGFVTPNEARATLVARGWKEIDGDHEDGDGLKAPAAGPASEPEPEPPGRPPDDDQEERSNGNGNGTRERATRASVLQRD